VPTRPINNCQKPLAPIPRRLRGAARRPWSNSAYYSPPGQAFPRTKPRPVSCSGAAEAGNPRGVTNLAALSDSGDAPSDPVKARALLSKAAETNSAEAQYHLGSMTADGVGGPKDDVAARALFEKAAAQGHPGVLERMGAFAQSGRGGSQDASAAKAYYEKAAALGNEEAKTALSVGNARM
jgi:TPR repeat protein